MVFTPSKDGKITAGQVLLPVSLLGFVLFIMLAFQASQILRERDALHEAKTQQDKPVEESQKVQAQLDALAVGTKKLADQGDKNAQTIIDRMKQIGITVSTKGSGSPAGTMPTTAAPAGVEETAPAVAPTTSSEEPKN